MQAKDICSIIKACARSGVTELKLGDMEISFEGSKQSFIEDPRKISIDALGTEHSDSSHGNDDPHQLELEGLSEDYSEEMDNTQMLIDSPSDFEQSIVDEYLENMEEVTDEAQGRERSERNLYQL